MASVLANTLLGNVKRVQDGTDHACSAWYAGNYLAEFANEFNGGTNWSIHFHVVPIEPCALHPSWSVSQLWLELFGNQLRSWPHS